MCREIVERVISVELSSNLNVSHGLGYRCCTIQPLPVQWRSCSRVLPVISFLRTTSVDNRFHYGGAAGLAQSRSGSVDLPESCRSCDRADFAESSGVSKDRGTRRRAAQPGEGFNYRRGMTTGVGGTWRCGTSMCPTTMQYAFIHQKGATLSVVCR